MQILIVKVMKNKKAELESLRKAKCYVSNVTWLKLIFIILSSVKFSKYVCILLSTSLMQFL